MQMAVKDVFDPKWLLNPPRSFRSIASAAHRDRGRLRGAAPCAARATPPEYFWNDEDLLTRDRGRAGRTRPRGGAAAHPGRRGTRPIGAPVNGRAAEHAGNAGHRALRARRADLVARPARRWPRSRRRWRPRGSGLPSSRWIIAGLLGTDGDPTIGGVVAANVGPAAHPGGAAAISCWACGSWTGAGQVIRNGGRVMKNVTGYDLVKLMAGSHGTLGILTEVAFKVLPDTAGHRHAALRGAGRNRRRGALPRARHALRGDGRRASAAGARTAAGDDDPPGGVGKLCRLSRAGDCRSGWRVRRVRETETGGDIWRDIRDVALFHDRPGDVWRLSVKPTDAPGIVDRIEGAEASMTGAAGWSGCWCPRARARPHPAGRGRDRAGTRR